eukprot:69531-Hanusia_phi.AAC.1
MQSQDGQGCASFDMPGEDLQQTKQRSSTVRRRRGLATSRLLRLRRRAVSRPVLSADEEVAGWLSEAGSCGSWTTKAR